jgi:hypothetical protein
MKLQDVDNTVNEAVLDLVKGEVQPVTSNMGSQSNRRYSQNVLAKTNFRNIFVRKMIGVLQGLWPEVVQRQNELQRDAEYVQAQMQAKNKNFQFGANPAAREADRVAAQTPQPGTIQTESLYFDKMLAEILSEAPAPPQQPPQVKKLTMSDYMVKVIQQYMQGVDISSSMKQITDLAKNVELTYQQNAGVPALRKLGDLLYDLAAAQKAKTQPPASEPEPISDEVNNIIAKFQQLDQEEKKELLAYLQKLAPK